MNITFQADLNGISPDQLGGFFEGWPNPPTAETLHRLLAASSRISLAVYQPSGEVVGFAQAISDGVLTAFIPLLEVRNSFQSQGIGQKLITHLLAQLEHLYAVDLSCDEHLAPFYQQFGFEPGRAMVRRKYERQNGEPA
jgi:ribosomal protein S18 acetylase RimI-like enzyme